MMLRRFSLVVLLTVLAPAAAVAQTVTAQELEALAQFSQTMQQHYQAGMAISWQMDEAEDAVDRYVNGDLPEAQMRSAVTAARAEARVAIDEFGRRLGAIGERPRLADRKRDRAMQAYLDMVHGLKGHLETQLEILDRLISTALAGDSAGYDIASADSLALAGEMIQAENVMLEASALGTGPNHPQTGLSEAVIGSNLAMLAALILTEDWMRGREPRVSRARDSIERGLTRASAGVTAGRRNAEAMWTDMSGRPAISEADQLSKRFVRELADAYGTAFDIETDMVAVMRVFLDALVAMLDDPAAASDATAAAVANFQEDLTRLTDKRMSEQSRRYRMVREFSAELATVQ